MARIYLNSNPGGQSSKRVYLSGKKADYAKAVEIAAQTKQASDQANSFTGMAKEAVLGSPGAVWGAAKQSAMHPIRTTEAALSGVGEGLRPAANLVIQNSPFNLGKIIPEIPKGFTQFRPQNKTEESIQRGFQFGGEAVPYALGGEAVGAIKGLSTLRPIAREIISDQVLTQALADKGTGLGDRAMAAGETLAGTGIIRGGIHAFGKINPFKGNTVPSMPAVEKPSLLPRPNLGQQQAIELVKRRAAELAPQDITPSTAALPDLGEDLSKMTDEKALLTMRGRTLKADELVDPKTGKVLSRDYVKMAASIDDGSKAKSPFMQKIDKIWRSGKGNVQQMGAAGKALVRMVEEQQFRASELKAAWKPKIQEVFKGMDISGKSRVFAALENKSAALNLESSQEREAFTLLQSINKYVSSKMKELGVATELPNGDKIPWVGLNPETYAPHYFPEKQIKSKDFKKLFMEQAISDGRATDYQQADTLFRQWSEQHMTRKAGSLEYQRDPNGIEGYSTDAEAVYQKYVDQVSRRLSEIEMFGQTHDKIKPLLSSMEEAGFDSKAATDLMESMYGSKPVNKYVAKALEWNQFTKLSLSAFQNLTQTGNTIVQGGFANTAKVLKDWITNPTARAGMRDLANLGDAFDEMIVSTESGLHPGKLMDIALGAFQKTEKLNRFIAANVGKLHAEDLYKTLQKNPANATAIRGLEHLGLDVEKIIKTGKLSPEDLSRAAYNMVGSTQFRINAMSLPVWTRTDAGKLFTQFKSFGYMQTKFIHDQIVKEAMKGNIAPLVRYMVTAPPAYMAAKYMRNVVAMKKEKEGQTDSEKMRDNINTALTATGTLPGSLLQGALYSYGATTGDKNKYKTDLNRATTWAGNFLGPTVSDVGSVLNASEQASDIKKQNLQERPEDQLDGNFPYKRLGSGWIPYVGPAIKNTMYGEWPKRQREIFRSQIKDAVREAYKTRDDSKIRAIMNNSMSQSHMDVLQDVYREVRLEQLPKEQKDIYDEIKRKRDEYNHKIITR